MASSHGGTKKSQRYWKNNFIVLGRGAFSDRLGAIFTYLMRIHFRSTSKYLTIYPSKGNRLTIKGRKLVSDNNLALSNLFKQLVRPVQVIVDDDEIVDVGLLREFNFLERSGQALLHRAFCFCPTLLQSRPERRQIRRGDEEVNRVQVCVFYLPNTL